VGVAWLRGTCGACRWCRTGRENLCERATFTGWDADGGFADATLVDERFVYRIAEGVPATAAAPLLCSGIVGYRALRSATLPPGGRLGRSPPTPPSSSPRSGTSCPRRCGRSTAAAATLSDLAADAYEGAAVLVL
jgi:hypothetical protein